MLITALLSILSPGVALAAGEMLTPGAAFPAWTLADHTGAQRSSAELAGKSYLVWFYPKAMTPGCTAEGRGLRDSHEKFVEAGVAVFGVSADAPADNAKFVEAERFPFPLLSDEKLVLAAAVGAVSDALPGKTRRISYLVGPDGKVLKAYSDVDPPAHAEQVLRDVAPAPH